MNKNPEIPEVEPEMTAHPISLYGQDNGIEDFPVLKAFQQYVDAEQEKARKRLVHVSILFGVLILAVIGVFVSLLLASSQRNQQLNDRLIEFVMQNKDNRSAVVVQPPVQQDNTAVLKLTEKLENLQQKLQESQRNADNARRDADAVAAKAAKEAADAKAALEAAKAEPKGPTAEELEIKRLKALLSEQRQHEKELQELRRQQELEVYRRKYYPELYAPKKKVSAKVEKFEEEDEEGVSDQENIDDISSSQPPSLKINEKTAVRYFDDDEDAEDESPKKVTPKKKHVEKKTVSTSAKSTNDKSDSNESIIDESSDYTIPVDKKGTRRKWHVPED